MLVACEGASSLVQAPTPAAAASPPTPITCSPTAIACDSFNRTFAGGWGTADVGGAWSNTGSAYAVAPASATIIADPTTPSNFLTSVATRDVDVLAEISPPPISNTQWMAAGVALRYVVSTGSWYQVDVYDATPNNAGNYTVQLKRKPDNVAIRPDVQTALAGGQPFWIRFEAQGVYPTTLRWKIWLDGTSEPSTWTDGGVDSTAPQQVAGGVGVVSYVSSGTSTVAFNSINATAVSPAVTPITCSSTVVACDSFNRTVSNGWGSADVGGAWNHSGSAYAVSPANATLLVDSTTPSNFLASVSVQDVDVLAEISPPPTTGTQAIAVGVALRYGASGGTWYQVDAWYASYNNHGNYSVQLKRKPDNIAIRPEVQTGVAGGTPFWLRMEAQGTYPTNLRWKLWPAGTTEPTNWTDSGTDANAPEQAAGGVGFIGYANTGQASISVNSLSASAIPSSITPISCSSTHLACDSFNRTLTSSWGAADVGGSWSNSGAAYAVTPANATIIADSTTPANFLSVSGLNVDLLAEITPPANNSTQTDDIGVALRYSSASGTWYQVNAFAASGINNGNLTVQLKRKPDNTLIRPEFPTNLAGGQPFWIRFEAEGTYPTTLRWKLWLDGTTEPAGWTDSGFDSTAAEQAAGGVGVVAFVDNGQESVAFNSLDATLIPAFSCPSTALACDSFNRTVATGWGTADIGGAWSNSGAAFSVTPGAGQIVTQNYLENDLSAMTPAQDVDYLARLTLPATQFATCNFTLRRTALSSSPFYFAGAWWDSTQSKVQMYIKRQDATGQNATLVGDTVSTVGGSVPPTMWVRVEAIGSTPTQLQARVWADGTPEPSSWLVSTTDSTPGIQGPGFFGLGCNSPNSDTFSVNRILLTPAGGSTVGGTSCPTGAIVCDTYSRSVVNGWGSADTGGLWTIIDNASNWSVANGAGMVNVAAAGQERSFLGSINAQDVDILTRITLPKSSSSGNQIAYVIGRYTAGATPTYYRVGVGQGPGQPSVFVRAQRSDGTAIGGDMSTNISAADGLVLRLRVQLQGINPTAIRARVWTDGGVEPTSWTLDTTDSTAADQVAGSVGLRLRNEDTAAIHTFQVSSYQVITMSPRAALPTGFATDTFNRTVSNGWGTANIGGTWSGSSSTFSVTPGRATIVASSSVPATFLSKSTAQNVDVLAWISPAASGTVTADVGVLARYMPASGKFYQVSAYYANATNGGNYVVQLKWKPNNVQIRPDFNTSIPGGTAVWIRVEAIGVSPTLLQWKIWQDGTPEPSAWTDSGTDNTAGLQGAGGIGCNAFASSGTVSPAFNAITATGL